MVQDFSHQQFHVVSLSLSLLQKIGKSHICRQAAVYMKTNVLFESNLQNEAVQSMIDKDQGTKKDQKLQSWCGAFPFIQKLTHFTRFCSGGSTEETAYLFIHLWISSPITYPPCNFIPSSDSKRTGRSLHSLLPHLFDRIDSTVAVLATRAWTKSFRVTDGIHHVVIQRCPIILI